MSSCRWKKYPEPTGGCGDGFFKDPIFCLYCRLVSVTWRWGKKWLREVRSRRYRIEWLLWKVPFPFSVLVSCRLTKNVAPSSFIHNKYWRLMAGKVPRWIQTTLIPLLLLLVFLRMFFMSIPIINIKLGKLLIFQLTGFRYSFTRLPSWSWSYL